MTENHAELKTVGERIIVNQIQQLLVKPGWLVGGIGHDTAALDISIADDEFLLVNTDRTGFNVAYQYGFSGPECIGDLGVTHAVSDIYAAGGQPFAITVALLLTDNSRSDFALAIMTGADNAARRYGSYIVGGDTKHAKKGSIIATALGSVGKKEHLTRAGAQPGDLLVTTGYVGPYLFGAISQQKKWELPDHLTAQVREAICVQQPPFQLAQELGASRLASACTDISDGLLVAVSEIASKSGCGAIVEEQFLPVPEEMTQVALDHGLNAIHLTLSGGDWEYMYAIPPKNYDLTAEIAKRHGRNLLIVGRVESSSGLKFHLKYGGMRELPIEGHDSFLGRMSGKSFYNEIADGRILVDYLP